MLRKVIIVGQMRVGGFICTIPTLRALKYALPQTEFVMVTVEVLRDLVERTPYLDRFISVPDLLLEQSQRPIDARGFTQFLSAMQDEHFDLGIQLRGYGLRTSPFFPLLGATYNVGFVGPSDMPLLDASIPFPQHGHLIDRCLELAVFLGASPAGRHTEFSLASQDHATASDMLTGAPLPLIGIHPTAREPERVWNPEHFATVARTIQQLYGGTIVLVTEQKENPEVAYIASQVEGPCLNLAGLTTLPVLGAIITRLAVLVTNDTGPAHIAYSLGTPTVTLVASTRKTLFWPPDDGPFIPLMCTPSAENGMIGASLETITEDQVVQAVGDIIR